MTDALLRVPRDVFWRLQALATAEGWDSVQAYGVSALEGHLTAHPPCRQCGRYRPACRCRAWNRDSR
jgi:hypothetical protein